jgi:hypothetical protein
VHKVSGWQVLTGDKYITNSDHEIIEWCFEGSLNVVDQAYRVRGWSLVPMLGMEEAAVQKQWDARRNWEAHMACHLRLDDYLDRDALEAKADAIEMETPAMLNTHTKAIELYARSKRWWSDSITQKRKDIGRV